MAPLMIPYQAQVINLLVRSLYHLSHGLSCISLNPHVSDIPLYIAPLAFQTLFTAMGRAFEVAMLIYEGIRTLVLR